jgi:dephospho-CoA kinase
MTLKVGITGGIGSGKSTICRVFKLLKVPIFEADIVAKQLLQSHPKIKKGLVHLFGEGVYLENGAVNRKKLAEIIFNDDVQLAKMNALVHPFVRNEFHDWVKQQNSPYVIHEAAILFESGFYKLMDFTILVSAPEEERIQRVVKRDGVSEKMVKERLAKQWTDAEKRKLADYEIINDNKNPVLPEIIQIDKRLREHGKIW